ncbi:hypothetical protein NIASO_07900 [Niabella soli DSM 19437]|uniref:Uncharacterized protein n=1 Tax=Niabella soli DSM 19437 TaxID=929713 RepID=W0F7L5_9BACT|nr:hypothetical protein NIASO_07900 [Niabella soli DSM 19437]
MHEKYFGCPDRSNRTIIKPCQDRPPSISIKNNVFAENKNEYPPVIANSLEPNAGPRYCYKPRRAKDLPF